MHSRKLSDDLADVARANQQTRDAALLRATTELFAQDLTHDDDEIHRYEELASHFLPKVSIADRALVAERLAACADAPSAVVRMLARDVIEVAAPVLRHSAVLDSFDLLAVIAATEVAHHRLIARRADIGDDVKRALRLTGDAEVMGYLDNGASMRAPAAPATDVTPLTATTPPPSPPPGTTIRPPSGRSRRFDLKQFLALDRPTRLRVIADIAMRPPIPAPPARASTPDRAFQSILGAAQIVGFARRGQIGELIMTIVDGLGLEADAVAGAVNDAGGEALAVLLKAMRLDETQAQQVFLLASPVGRNVQAFFPLTDLYAGMEQSTAQTLCDAWRLSASVRGSGYEPHLAENGERRRSTAHESPRRDEGEDLARRA